MIDRFDLSFLSDPAIFAVNRLPGCSDHDFFASAAEMAAGSSSLVRSLNGVWKAHLALKAQDAPDSLLTDFSADDPLVDMAVPGEFQLQYPEWDPPQYVNKIYPWDGLESFVPPQVSDRHNPTVTLLRTFDLSEKDMKAGRVLLVLDGAEPSAAVWVNGTFIGYSEDSFTPHRFDITGAVRVGENRLAVRVFKRCTGTWVESQDFWRFSGIHRGVSLILEPAAHVEDIAVTTTLKNNYADASVTVAMKVERARGSVRLTLRDADGTAVWQAEQPAAAEMRFEGELRGIHLWNAEQPYLYTLSAELCAADGAVTEVSSLKVGMREFRRIGDVMCLNGKRLVFRGVNRHEFNCDTGRVMTREIMLEDLRAMKRMNMNAIRTCHYPNHSELYRLCDELGFYVCDESNLETHASWDVMHDWVIPHDKPEWYPLVSDRCFSMMARDKNHACVIIWSLGNESYGGTVLRDLAQAVRRMDPTRPVQYESVTWDARFRNETTDFESRMYAKVQDIRDYLDKNPDLPFINCEYNHAMGNSCGGLHLYRELESEYNMYQGGFIWDFLDQGLRMKRYDGAERLSFGGDWGDRPNDNNFNTNGLLLGDHSDTPKVQEVHRVFQWETIEPLADRVRVTNDRLFSAIEDCTVAWQYMLDGRVIAEGQAECPAIAPGETAEIMTGRTAADLPLAEGEVVLTAKLCVNSATELLDAGFSIAEGQAVLSERRLPVSEGAMPAIVRGDANVGIRGEKLKVLLSKTYPTMVSFRDALGQETMVQQPLLSLFRAPNDNDVGNGDNRAQGIWHAVSRYSAVAGPDVEQDGSHADISYTFTNAILPGAEIKLTYSVTADDALKVTLAFPGVQNQPDLSALGLAFRMDPRYSHVSYYGMGPMENYCDRCTGAMLGTWEYEAMDGWTRYCKPQESGSRMGVRRMAVTNDAGHGVLFEAIDQPLEISVQPWLPEELTAASHPDELEIAHRTVVDVAGFRKGIGGDDSWGAPVLPQFKYPSDKEYSFSFLMRGI